jgi:hypothetical protein
MTPGELAGEYERTCRELAASYTELGEVKIQYNWLYLRGYKDSVSTSVSGRDRDGEIAAMSVKEDQLRLEGEIGALSTIRDLLVTLGK